MMRGVLKNRVISLSFIGKALRHGSPSPSPRKPFLRSLSSYESDDDIEVVVYCHRFCPLAGKVAAFMQYYNIPHETVWVTPITKEEIKWSQSHKSLPMFVVDDQYDEPILDSTEFINTLYKNLVDPDYDPNADVEEKKWREWVDNYVVHVVSANAYRTYSKALKSFSYVSLSRDVDESFNYVSPDPKYVYAKACNSLSRLKRMATIYAGAAERYYVAKKLMKEHNITDAREELRRAMQQWHDALKRRKFLSGRKKPNLADLAFYAALRTASIVDLELCIEMLRAHPNLRRWYFAVYFEVLAGCSDV